MRTFILGALAAVALAVTTGGAVQASGHPHGSHGYHNYHLTYGTSFRYGYFYTGRHHHHWSYRVWDGRFGRYHYWDPSVGCYYWWCEADNCFYPIRYAR
jgi:hypothetical protein